MLKGFCENKSLQTGIGHVGHAGHGVFSQYPADVCGYQWKLLN